jgi:isoprenylcysteine carboxyl methyltransferase (ICMT) family protein YpbQ
MVVFGPIIMVTSMLSTTFYVIFIAEALGSGDFMQGMGLVGVLVVIRLTVQTILDYPTGGI